MSKSGARRSPMISVADMVESVTTPVKFYWGDILREKGRLAIIGQAKAAKSFFAMQLAIQMATGTKFLEMTTTKCNVLYLNFEISQEMFQERIQDVTASLDVDLPKNMQIIHIAGGMALETDSGLNELSEWIEEFEETVGHLDFLFIDPRTNSMQGDENQNAVMRAWTTNVYSLMTQHTCGMVIVHHQGKGTSGMGRGSSVFDGWVEGAIWLDEPMRPIRRLRIISRDSDESGLVAKFEYPKWSLTSEEETARISKVVSAEVGIKTFVSDRQDVPLIELRTSILATGVASWAYKKAQSKLEKSGEIVIYQDPCKAGNHKRVKLPTHE